MTITMPKQVQEILSILHHNNFEAYIVGGCVRDCLVHKYPNDWDICTNANPNEIKDCLKNYVNSIIDTGGIKHGTVTVVKNHNQYEITTYRKDGNYSDNRHPDSVEFVSDLKEDLKRRDFTINAMAYSDESGIIDFFDGQKDLLEKHEIKCVGNADDRFNEDALRILRALRFSATYGFNIEEQTEISIHKNKHLLKNISVERIRDEFEKIIYSYGAANVLCTFADVFQEVFPELNIIYKHKEPTENYLLMCEQFNVALSDHLKPALFLYYLQSDIILSEKILKRLKFANCQIRPIICVLQMMTKYNTVEKINKIELKKLLNLYGYSSTLDFIEFQLRINKINDLEYLRIKSLVNKIEVDNECYNLSRLNINGNHILALGVKDIQVGFILNKLLDEVISETLCNELCALKKRANEIIQEHKLLSAQTGSQADRAY